METPPPASPLWAGLVRSSAHGPLPVLLLVLTAATGVIDAVSLLALGRVFVANMTGNVVFLGMALAGAPGFSLAASVAALAGFLLGAFAGGGVLRRRGGHRGRLLRDVGAAELVLVAAALVLTATAPVGAVVMSHPRRPARGRDGTAEHRRPPARGTGPDHHRVDDDADRHRRGHPRWR